MQTNCLGANIDIHAIDRRNFAFAQHSQDPRRSLGRIVQQRIRPRTGNQRSVCSIIAVRKNFVRDLKSVRFARSRKRAVYGAKKINVASTLATARAIASASLIVAHRHVVKRSVRLDVVRANARGLGDCRKNPELINDCVKNLGRFYRQFLTPKIFSIEKTRMRTNRDIARARGFDRCAHCIGIPGVKSASNVGGCHQRQQLDVMTRAFAQVGVKIDNQAH